MNGQTKILVVEDENIVAMDLRANLERLGYAVTETVGTGQEAIRSATSNPPDLVLMDIQLRGGMKGTEAAERISKEHGIPIVYLTAYSDDATVEQARVTGPFGYLLKPFEERELHIVIEMAVSRHRAQREHEQLLREQAARAAVEQEQRWSQFLADASAAVSASLSVEATLQAVARLAVPERADVAAVHLKDDQGIRTVAIFHVAGLEEKFWKVLGRFPANPELPHGFPEVIRTGKPELLAEITPAILEAVSGNDAETLRELRGLDVHAQLCVPLIIRGEPAGAITLLMTESRRRYTEDDLERAMELARRCASAIDNARLYQLAQDAVRSRDEFLSVAAHELRTPLSALMLSLHTVHRTALQQGEDAMVKKSINLLKQCERLSALVDRLLDVSRITSGKLELRLEHVDLAKLVRETCDTMKEAAERAGSPLVVAVPESVTGSWDPLRIAQVVTNLLSNAIKFSSAEPIEVTLDATDGQALLAVRDHGTGIAPERLPFIFERFERGVSVRNYGGLGLGLYVARQIVTAHGGRIEVESAPSEGAVFRVHLPRRPEPRF
jgi:signal transduction histidine kinase/AmiR/NasT family two-component response regulator